MIKDMFLKLCLAVFIILFCVLMIPIVIIGACLMILGIALLPLYLFYRIIAKKIFKKTFNSDCFSFEWSYKKNGEEKTKTIEL